MTGRARLEVLLLCDYRTDIAATVREHIDSLVRYSEHRVRRISILGDLPGGLDLRHFDVVVIHYSLVLSSEAYVSASTREALRRFGGLKAIFIQDEYRFIDATIAAMLEVGVHLLFTCVPEREIEKVYPKKRLPGVVKVNVLTGYVPERLLARSVLPYAQRPIDVGYRARKVPAWLGDLGQEKYIIGRRFADDARSDGLKLDIAFREEDRLYGDAWTGFVARCKAMLGVESGASVFDFSGDIQRQVEAYTKRDPNVGYHELRALYFSDLDGRIGLNQISPRCFEAAALRTLMVLYEGEYSGRLVPWQHYVPLRKDHSNHADVVALLKDTQRAQEIVDCAYREVACDPQNGFKAFSRQFDECLTASLRPGLTRASRALDDSAFARAAAPTWRTRRRRATRRLIEGANRFVFGYVLARATPEARESVHHWLRRVLEPLRVRLRPFLK